MNSPRKCDTRPGSYRRPGQPLPALGFAVLLAVLSPDPGASQQTALAAGAAIADGFVAEQICWAYYEPHQAWYAAHVVAVSEDSLRVRHFDGYEETVARNWVMRDRMAVGDSLGAYFRADTTWYGAVVIARRGLEVVVEYGDGEQESTWLRWLRLRSLPPGDG